MDASFVYFGHSCEGDRRLKVVGTRRIMGVIGVLKYRLLGYYTFYNTIKKFKKRHYINSVFVNVEGHI
jgi:hypothetical protein